MNIKLLTEHHLEFLSLKGGCTGSSESTHVKMPNCWKPHALAHLSLQCLLVHTCSSQGWKNLLVHLPSGVPRDAGRVEI